MGALVRRARLPNDRRTPAAARALGRSVLEEARLDALLNEALLLTTELSTNAVVHAGTELEVEVEADAGGLTVTVTDFAPGPVEQLTVWSDQPIVLSPDRSVQPAEQGTAKPFEGGVVSSHAHGGIRSGKVRRYVRIDNPFVWQFVQFQIILRNGPEERSALSQAEA